MLQTPTDSVAEVIFYVAIKTVTFYLRDLVLLVRLKIFSFFKQFVLLIYLNVVEYSSNYVSLNSLMS